MPETAKCPRTTMIYTLKKANSALKLFKQILGDVRVLKFTAMHLKRQLEELEKEDCPDPWERNFINEDLALAEEDEARYVQELKALGLQVMDIDNGCGRVPAMMKGSNPIFLYFSISDTKVNQWGWMQDAGNTRNAIVPSTEIL